ncbi:hypothetical protein [Paraprevotella xylaniphila]|jgi:hypothetical protein|uniref:hypothetical protein n=1 Tax=Paraprevotella xylaniphila TaxID=454155 RepID=UPI001558DADA|nr:hypothetical protein [Paraprevotella xylaniphila]
MLAAFHEMGLVARPEGDIHFRRVAPRVFCNEIRGFIVTICGALSAYYFFENKPETLPVHMETPTQMRLLA